MVAAAAAVEGIAVEEEGVVDDGMGVGMLLLPVGVVTSAEPWGGSPVDMSLFIGLGLIPGFLEEDEPAECDERELQVTHTGDHPPHRYRQYAHRVP